jgi:hypothetical protein
MNSSKVYILLLLSTVVFAMILGCSESPVSGSYTEPQKQVSVTMPNGSHYSLNIIGAQKEKDASMIDNSGHVIFVNLSGKTRILLTEGDFAVLDANGTDGTAKFQLPNPDPTNSGITTYSVWVRALGKPGGKATITTAATDPLTGELIYSLESVVSVRDKGKSSFSDVSRELLYIFADLDEDGIAERYPLFDDRLEGYLWEYDNNGLKLLQVRFYPVSSNIN